MLPRQPFVFCRFWFDRSFHQRTSEGFFESVAARWAVFSKPRATSSLNPWLTQWELIYATNLVFITREPGHLKRKNGSESKLVPRHLVHAGASSQLWRSASKIFRAGLPENMMAEQVPFRTGCALLGWLFRKDLMKKTFDVQLSCIFFLNEVEVVLEN